MKRFLAFTLALCLAVGLCGCIIRLPWQTEPTDPILMEGYVAVDDLPAYDRPAEDGTVQYTYHRGYYVAVYELDGSWGRTELGWIRWDQLASDYEAALNGGETEATDATDTGNSDDSGSGDSNTSGKKPSGDAQETTAPETSDSLLPEPTNNSAIIGSWYAIGGTGDYRSFDVLDFDSHGYYGEDSWSIYAPDLDTVIPNGGFAYRYSLVGNTLYLQPTGSPDPEDNNTVSSSKVSINGNTLVWHGTTYLRGDYDDAYAAARAALTPEETTAPTEEETTPVETTEAVVEDEGDGQ